MVLQLNEGKFGGNGELNLAVGQILSSFTCIFPDFHPGKKNPDSNEIEPKVLEKSTGCTGTVLLLKSLCLRAQVPRPKSSF